MTVIYLLRHAMTEWNLGENRYCGSNPISDIGLNALGIKQAKALSHRLKHVGLEAVYSSPMKRALQTAQLIAKPHALEVIILDELRERNYGRWEGLSVEEIKKQVPGSYEEYEEDPAAFRPFEGETGFEVGERVVKAVDFIGENHKSGSVALVAHEATNRLLLCQLLGINVSDYRKKLVQSNASITVLDYNRGCGKLLLYNDINHLRYIP